MAYEPPDCEDCWANLRDRKCDEEFPERPAGDGVHAIAQFLRCVWMQPFSSLRDPRKQELNVGCTTLGGAVELCTNMRSSVRMKSSRGSW